MAESGGDTFSEAKAYTKVLFQLGKDVLPTELNEFQDVVRVMLARYIQDTLGDGTIDAGLKVTATPATVNSVTFAAGSYFSGGMEVRLAAALVIDYDNYLPSPKTPVGARTDYAYMKLYESEVTAVDDPDLIPFPALGEETTRRRKLNAEFYVDTSVPASDVAEIWAGGVRYVTLAQVDRTAAVGQIVVGDITDMRDVISWLPTSYFDIEHEADPLSASVGLHRKVTALPDTDLVVAVNSASTKLVTVKNLGAGSVTLGVEGEMKFTGTLREKWGQISAVQMWEHAQITDDAGAGTLEFVSPVFGVSRAALRVNGVGNYKQFLIPVDLPENCKVMKVALAGYAGAGTGFISVGLVSWSYTSNSWTTLTGANVQFTLANTVVVPGNFNSEKSFATQPTWPRSTTAEAYLSIQITNTGINYELELNHLRLILQEVQVEPVGL